MTVKLGTHDELIQNPEGAYTRLVRMQGGNNNDNNQAEESTNNVDREKEDMNPGSLSRSISRSSSRGLSAMRSSSRGSSRTSFAASVPGFTNIHEAIERDAENNNELTDEENERRRKKVSIKRLAALNKPELPVLALGSLAACVQGVIFPMFGLLISTAIKIFYEPPHELKKDSKFWALMFLGLGCVTFVAIPVQNYFFGIAGGKLIQRIRSLSFQKIVHQDISYFDDPANSRYSLLVLSFDDQPHWFDFRIEKQKKYRSILYFFQIQIKRNQTGIQQFLTTTKTQKSYTLCKLSH